jgi:hypothetical protein
MSDATYLYEYSTDQMPDLPDPQPTRRYAASPLPNPSHLPPLVSVHERQTVHPAHASHAHGRLPLKAIDLFLVKQPLEAGRARVAIVRIRVLRRELRRVSGV